MNHWQEGLMIFGMMAVTFGVRYPILALSGRVKLPAGLVEALGYVPVAVLSAIVLPMMLAPDGTVALRFSNDYLVAGAASVLVAAISRHLLLTIVSGMSFFLVLRFFF